ncbi:hypothetical protein M885DRAFT_620975 [Pelagophyceae sp. CCMP2097]|nr:hypothetical protein M885DRAFT_620975 [Pelagophyceae sp. CCMP2097]
MFLKSDDPAMEASASERPVYAAVGAAGGGATRSSPRRHGGAAGGCWSRVTPETRTALGAAALLGVGGLTWGLELGAISGAIQQLRVCYGLSPSEVGLLVAVFGPGEVVGAAVGGAVGDRFGRRAALVLANSLVVVSSVAFATATTVRALFVFRGLSGMASGSSMVAQIAWGSEVAPVRRRGSVMACYEVCIALGYLMSFSAFAGVHARADGWRLLVALPALPAAAQLAAVLAVAVESPTWLEASQKAAAAPKGAGGAAGARASAAAYGLEVWEWRLPSATMTTVLFFMFFTGGFNIRVYALEVFQKVGLSPARAASMMVALGLVKLSTTILALAGIDYVGRRPLLGWSLVLTVRGLAGRPGVFHHGEQAVAASALTLAFGMDFSEKLRQTLAVAASIIYMVSFQMGFGTINFVLLGELFPSALKGRLISAQQIPAAIFKFSTQWVFSIARRGALGSERIIELFAAHAVIALLGVAFTRFGLVETKDLDAHEIRTHLEHAPLAQTLGYTCRRRYNDTALELATVDAAMRSPDAPSPAAGGRTKIQLV